jgi:hypothetical protein
MRERERKLGLRANEHVEKEMVRILDAALSQWSANVQQTLHTGAATNGTTPTNGAAPHHAATANGSTNGSAQPTIPMVPLQATAPGSTATAVAQPLTNGQNPQATAQAQASQATVRSNFNLPNGSKLP